MGPWVPTLIGTIINSVTPNANDEAPQAPTMPAATQAVFRTIPEDAPIADMQPPEGGFVVLNRTQLQMAAGAQIRNQSNMVVQPASLTRTEKVRFTTDEAGQVSKVWILTPQELELPAPKYR